MLLFDLLTFHLSRVWKQLSYFKHVTFKRLTLTLILLKRNRTLWAAIANFFLKVHAPGLFFLCFLLLIGSGMIHTTMSCTTVRCIVVSCIRQPIKMKYTMTYFNDIFFQSAVQHTVFKMPHFLHLVNPVFLLGWKKHSQTRITSNLHLKCY